MGQERKRNKKAVFPNREGPWEGLGMFWLKTGNRHLHQLRPRFVGAFKSNPDC